MSRGAWIAFSWTFTTAVFVSNTIEFAKDTNAYWALAGACIMLIFSIFWAVMAAVTIVVDDEAR